MRWGDVDGDERLWTLAGAATKAGRAHVVPRSPLAMEILGDLPRFKGGEFAFSTTAGEKPVSGFSRAKKRADTLAGMTDWRLHDLRRTAATEMRRLGIGRDVVGAILNHAPRGVTAEVYDQWEQLPEKRHALEAWARKIESIIRPTDDKVVPLRVKSETKQS